MEAARGAHTAITAVHKALSTLDGEKLMEWQAEHADMVKLALAVEALRDEDGAGGFDG